MAACRTRTWRQGASGWEGVPCPGKRTHEQRDTAQERGAKGASAPGGYAGAAKTHALPNGGKEVGLLLWPYQVDNHAASHENVPHIMASLKISLFAMPCQPKKGGASCATETMTTLTVRLRGAYIAHARCRPRSARTAPKKVSALPAGQRDWMGVDLRKKGWHGLLEGF